MSPGPAAREHAPVETPVIEIDDLRLQRVLYADALVPPSIMGLTTTQIDDVSWRVPQWGEGEQVRVSASAWVVEHDGRRIVLDPMMAADDLLHDPAGEAFHREAITDRFEQAG